MKFYHNFQNIFSLIFFSSTFFSFFCFLPSFLLPLFHGNFLSFILFLILKNLISKSVILYNLITHISLCILHSLCFNLNESGKIFPVFSLLFKCTIACFFIIWFLTLILTIESWEVTQPSFMSYIWRKILMPRFFDRFQIM